MKLLKMSSKRKRMEIMLIKKNEFKKIGLVSETAVYLNDFRV